MDLDEIVDTDHPAPHMLPPEHVFAGHMGALGIGDGDRLVVYDNSPLHSAARARFMLRSFGARQVAMLDGGLARWKAEGRPVESGSPRISPARFTASLDRTAIADKAGVQAILGSDEHVLVDARSTARFLGEEGEPRPGLASGHIPGSRNLPQSDLFSADNTMKRGEALREAFEAAGVDLSKPMITTCGSGVTAAVLALGAELLGKEDVRLYDGSWSEWGADHDTPKATGAA
jgi:thiosulfate/3-mercaptopyruvate sulfurtransferase